MKTKASSRLTLSDRLSRLTFTDACKLLGSQGKELLQAGGCYEINLEEDVYLKGDLLRVKFSRDTVVTVTLMAEARQRLHSNCTQCTGPCEHLGAALSMVLEHKTALGLAAAPKERAVIETLDEQAVIKLALDERRQRAKEEKMHLRAADANTPWTDYSVTSAVSGKTYRVALRGEARGDSFCTCPDFRTNRLGTCKHVLHVLDKVKRKFPAQARTKKYRPPAIAVYLRYGDDLELRLEAPERLPEDARTIVSPLRNRPLDDIQDLLRRVTRLERAGHSVTIYPDAEEFIIGWLHRAKLQTLVAEMRRDPARHPLRRELLKTELLPYQLDGIAFSAGAGRAILADDMGLGKTIQGVGVAEFLAREAGIKKVLVICPASLKSQWRAEIERFCDRSCQIILGRTAERTEQYANDAFFTLANYEQVVRDLGAIERVPWDLIILDEGQRIKNWEAKTARTIKGLRSPFALVLSGTPLENRLEELYSVVQFIDDRRLGPAYRFFHRHRVADERGKVLGYKNLNTLRELLRPMLLRRTRESVQQDLPPRTTEIVRIAPTEEQKTLHDAHMQMVVKIIRKKFLTEMDLLRLQKSLLMCRMAADSTFLVEKEPPGCSSKLDRLQELLADLLDEPDRKIVLFSEWTTMLDLIEKRLGPHKKAVARLDGSVPQAQRQALVQRFQTDPDCRLFLTSNAGSTGLNLQAANTVINVDLPWNPAVLEQRVARAHRMGQKNPVQVYVLVTEDTLEENLLVTLAAKRDLAMAALDPESETDEVSMECGMEELKRRLEVLLGAAPTAPLDASQQAQVAASNEQVALAQRERVAAAGGELLGAAFKFLGELVQPQIAAAPAPALVGEVRGRLDACVDQPEGGPPRLTFTLPNRAALDQLAQTLAQLMSLSVTPPEDTPPSAVVTGKIRAQA